MKCQQFKDIIDDYIDGNLPLKKRWTVRKHLNSCLKCQTTLSQQKAVMEKLHELPQLECPDFVVENVFETVGLRDRQGSWLTKIYEALSESFSWKLSFAAAAAVIVLLMFVFYPKNEFTEYDQVAYSEEEIEQAKKDVELAFAYFNYYAQKSESVIEEQVFSKPIVKPLRTTIKIAFKPLLNGGQL